MAPAPEAARAGRALVELNDIVKIYTLGEVEVRALDGVSLTIAAGEFVAVMGPSGSGKSTCMNVLGCLDRPSAGAYLFRGVDVGALSLGAGLGAIAVVVRQEIVLFIMGGVFVVETLSVMIQVIYFKATGGKRIFRMAPLHHHYELEGWKESQVVVRFWIITIMLVLFGLSTLKIR